MKHYLISYATPDHYKNQRRLNASALKFGVDEAKSYTRKDIQKSHFFEVNRSILEQKRGAGYWLWKPYIILDQLNQIQSGDCLIYSDSGIEIIRDITPLIDLCVNQNGILLFRNHGNLNKKWTKRDCFVLMECDEEKYHDSEQVAASFQLYIKNSWSVSFLQEWLYYSQCRDIITDSPNTLGLDNFPDFVDHRHDQSILSLLAVKHGIDLFRDPSQWGNHKKLPDLREADDWLLSSFSDSPGAYSDSPCAMSLYPTLLNHHRKRPPLRFDQRVKGKIQKLYRKAQKLLSK